MPIRQTICYPIVKPEAMSLDELCRHASEIGYAGIECWGRDERFPEALEAARRYGLTMVSMVGHGSIASGFNDVGQHDRIEAELRESIDLAAGHGIAGLICFSGNRLRGQSDLEGLVACTRGLKRIAPCAEERGVNLNIELLNSRIDHPGYLCDRSDWGVALCEAVGSPRVKLLYDIYHMQIMEGDVIRHIRKAMPCVGHIHTAGNPGRHDMDDTQELNYRGICRAIAESGYELYVGHEFKPTGDPIAALRQAYEVCKGQ